MDKGLASFNRNSKFTGLLGYFFFLVVIVAIAMFVRSEVLFGFVAVLVSVVSLVIFYLLEQRINTNFRNTYIKEQVALYFRNYLTSAIDMGSYESDSETVERISLTLEDFKASRLWYPNQKLKKMKAYDVLKGVIGSVPFNSSDVRVKGSTRRMTREGTSTEIGTLFSGRFIKFEFPKAFTDSVALDAVSLQKVHPRLRNIKAEMHTKGNETRSNIASYPLQIKREDAVIKAYASDQKFGEQFFNEAFIHAIETLVGTHNLSIALRTREDALYMGLMIGTQSSGKQRLTFQLPLMKSISEEVVKQVKSVVDLMAEMVEAIAKDDTLFKS